MEQGKREAVAHIERLLVQATREAEQAAAAAGAARRVERVAVVGAGLMGIAIAATHLKAGLRVLLSDSADEARALAPRRVAEELALQLGGVPEHNTFARRQVDELLQTTSDPAAVGSCDLVLETVPESISVKRAVYDVLGPRLGPDTVLASNTSTIPIGRLATSLPYPQTFCGLHFFHPVRSRSLVEVIPGPKTSAATLALALHHALAIAKTPLVVGDSPGFVVNRLLNPYLSEAMELLLDGATIEQIENVATDFGMAMGPLRILDEIGLDVTLHGGAILFEAFPERVPVSPLLVRMVKQGRLGRKSGRGFFEYARKTPWEGPGRPDPEVLALIAKWSRSSAALSDELVRRRLFFGMLLEAIRLVEEKAVAHPGYIDLAVVLGLGFPCHRGGLLYGLDQMRPRSVLSQLDALRAIGPRFAPPDLLRDMATEDRRFFGSDLETGNGR